MCSSYQSGLRVIPDILSFDQTTQVLSRPPFRKLRAHAFEPFDQFDEIGIAGMPSEVDAKPRQHFMGVMFPLPEAARYGICEEKPQHIPFGLRNAFEIENRCRIDVIRRENIPALAHNRCRASIRSSNRSMIGLTCSPRRTGVYRWPSKCQLKQLNPLNRV